MGLDRVKMLWQMVEGAMVEEHVHRVQKRSWGIEMVGEDADIANEKTNEISVYMAELLRL